MKRLSLLLLALLAAAPLWAQTEVRINRQSRSTTLQSGYDLNAAAQNDARIFADTNVVASNTYTLSGQPDVCRLQTITITDANSSITAGIVTIVGLDCVGRARTCTFDFSVVATRGSGAKVLTSNGPLGAGCYLSSVTSVSDASMTGIDAGTDKIRMGDSSTGNFLQWATWGQLLPPGASGENRVDPFGRYDPQPGYNLITTGGAASTTVTGVSTNNAFTNVLQGDLITFIINNQRYERKVTARGSANSITISSPAVKIPAGGVPFQYAHWYVTADPTDDFSVDLTAGWRALVLTWSVDNNVDTGGVYMKLECSTERTPAWPTAPWVVVPSRTSPITCDSNGCAVASAATQIPVEESVNLDLSLFSRCRVGWRFGTADDADGAGNTESLNAQITLGR